MERLPVSSLLIFKAVSKQWKSTIVSKYFQERQLMQRQQSGDPNVLMVSVSHDYALDIESLRTLVLGSSSSVKIPSPWENICYLVSNASCDGLVCLYDSNNPVLLVNPTTRWYRRLPLCQLQEFFISLDDEFYKFRYPSYNLGFGKDKFTGTYKAVWLYDANDECLGRTIRCEVFDFITNAWRNVSPTAPYWINGDPAYIDGSFYWFIFCEETKILSFDLHTEAFQVLCSAPFANDDAYKTVMCNLNNRLCVSEITWPNQVIWSFDSSNKTWHKLCSIDLEVTSHWFGRHHHCALSPLALFDGEEKKKKKTKLLFYCRASREKLFVHDLEPNHILLLLMLTPSVFLFVISKV